MSNLAVWNFLYKYIKQAKYMVIALLVMFLAASFLMRMQNFLVAQMIGVITDPSSYINVVYTLTKYLLYLAVVILCLSSGDALRRVIEAHFVSFFNAKLAKDLFVMTHKHSLSFFDEEMSGNISGKVRNILNNIDHMYSSLLFGLTLPIIEILMSLTFIAVANKILALLLGTLNLLFWYLFYILTNKLHPMQH